MFNIPKDLSNDYSTQEEQQRANFLSVLATEFVKMKVLSKREMKMLSILITRPHYEKYIKEYLLNTKHIKGKHMKAILTALESLTPNYNLSDDSSSKLLERIKRGR